MAVRCASFALSVDYQLLEVQLARVPTQAPLVLRHLALRRAVVLQRFGPRLQSIQQWALCLDAEKALWSLVSHGRECPGKGSCLWVLCGTAGAAAGASRGQQEIQEA